MEKPENYLLSVLGTISKLENYVPINSLSYLEVIAETETKDFSTK